MVWIAASLLKKESQDPIQTSAYPWNLEPDGILAINNPYFMNKEIKT